jgi:hypothetical protein
MTSFELDADVIHGDWHINLLNNMQDFAYAVAISFSLLILDMARMKITIKVLINCLDLGLGHAETASVLQPRS